MESSVLGAYCSPHATTVYILVPPSPLFAAHWSLFLPRSTSTASGASQCDNGLRIHVAGDLLNGFLLEIVRDYNIKQHRGLNDRKFAIGSVSPEYLAEVVNGELENVHNHEGLKDESEGGGYIDNTPRNDFEKICIEIEAPGPSLRRTDKTESSVRPSVQKSENRDCQWWVREVATALTREGILQSLEGNDKGPLEVLAAVPVH